MPLKGKVSWRFKLEKALGKKKKSVVVFLNTKDTNKPTYEIKHKAQ